MCNKCGCSFTRVQHLVEHKQRQHGDGKKLSCDQCTKQFHAKQQLERHKRIHTGEKPHSCNFCQKKFSRSHHLKKHMKVHLKMRSTAAQEEDKGVVHYDIPSPSHTLVIHTSSLPEEEENQVQSTVYSLVLLCTV